MYLDVQFEFIDSVLNAADTIQHHKICSLFIMICIKMNIFTD